MNTNNHAFSSQDSYPSIDDSSSTPYRQSTVNYTHFQQKNQSNSNPNSAKLDHIIARAFSDANNQQFIRMDHNQLPQDQRKRLDFFSVDICNKNQGQLENGFFFDAKHEAQSIVNSSNKDSFQRVKERVPGKLTHSQDSVKRSELKKSQDDDYYYNFTIKASTLNSDYLFNGPQYSSKIANQDFNNLNLNQTSSNRIDSSPRVQNQNNQTSYQPHYTLQQNFQRPNPNKSGFIRQNKLNSKSQSKPGQLNTSKRSQPHKNHKLQISEHQQFQIHFNKQKPNNILDDQFWRKIDQHKSTAQSLKQTFDSQKTNNYQFNSHSNHDYPIKPKFRTQYSQICHNQHLEDSIRLSQANPFAKEYETDLFDFIKHDLINVTLQNREVSEKQRQIVAQFQAQKAKNIQLHHLYKKKKAQFSTLINQQKSSVQSLQTQIKLLEEQIFFSKQHSISVEQSNILKIKKQDQFYFRHKTNLQQMILSNNQQITDLKNQFFKLPNFDQSKNLSINSKFSEKLAQKKSINVQINENQRLKDQLKEEQLLYEKSLKRLEQNHKIVHELQKSKAKEIKTLVLQFEAAKRLSSTNKSQRFEGTTHF